MNDSGDNQAYSVSVISAVLNRSDTIGATIRSIAVQNYPYVEYIIVDGGSTDGTVAVIQQHESSVDTLITGPDDGIGDAMNRGVKKCNGDFVIFLHADDRFVDSSALSRAMSYVSSKDIIWAGDIEYGDTGQTRNIKPRPLNILTRLKNPLPHQGVLCPRTLFSEIGYFDTDFRIDMDYDLWLRAYLSGYEMRRVPIVIANMGTEGISSRKSWPDLMLRFEEERRVHRKHATTWSWQTLYRAYWPLYLTYRKYRSKVLS